VSWLILGPGGWFSALSQVMPRDRFRNDSLLLALDLPEICSFYLGGAGFAVDNLGA
jgi:hypothetical protein